MRGIRQQTARIGAFEQHARSVGGDAGFLEEVRHRDTLPSCVACRRPAGDITGALEHRLDIVSRRLDQVGEAELDRTRDSAFDLQLPGAQGKLGLAEVVADKEQFRRRDGPFDGLKRKREVLRLR